MSALERASESWGERMPDWVGVLARACDATSANKVAKRLGRSGALVSQVLRGRYAGDMEAVEELVRGVLMAEVVACPALGDIPTNECRLWREKARHFTNTNALRVQMYRACTRCPRMGGRVDERA